MYSLQFLEGILIPLGVCVVLPVLVVWLVMRKKTNETNRRTEVMLAAIEKGSDVNAEKLLGLFDKTGKPTKTTRTALKERLMGKLLASFILMGIGIAFGIYALLMSIQGGSNTNDLAAYSFVSAVLLLVGAAFLISYFISRKFLAEELGLADKSGETGAGAPEEGDTAQQDGAEQPAAAEKEN